MPEVIQFFKEKLNTDVKTSDEAITNETILKYIQKCIEETNKVAVSRAWNI